MTTFTVQFRDNKIGRGNRATPLTGVPSNELSSRILKYARRFLFSSDVDVEAWPAGDGYEGHITAGWRIVGRFTATHTEVDQ